MVSLKRPEGASKSTRRLLDEIKTALKPYLRSEEKPPLSPAQLLVIALLFSPDATFKLATRWILANIPYYRNRILDDVVRNSERCYTYTDLTSSRDFLKDLGKVRYQLCVPISERADDKGSPDIILNVVSQESRSFLGNFLTRHGRHHQHAKPFPFMRLPAELRLAIYELVLTFPKSGVCLNRETPESRPSPKIYVKTRDMNNAEDGSWGDPIRGRFGRPLNLIRGRRLSYYLAILQTSKQVYAESMPVFYQHNRFVCLDVLDLYWLLEHTPDIRRKHIRDIKLKIEPPRHGFYTMADLTQCSKWLKSIPGLRTLTITMCEKTWAEITNRRGNPKYPDLLEIAPVKVLRSMRGLQEVKFYGDCASISKILVPEMTTPLLEPSKKKRASRKRAAGDGDDGQDIMGAGKVKKVKKSKNY